MITQRVNFFSYGFKTIINLLIKHLLCFQSGKLVQKMFDQLHELLEDPKLFLFVLIDEVESLTMSRKESKNEPSDGMRVVNALLTQIDQLKSYSNVLVLATSNLRNSIDDAFLDRADIYFEVGLPSKVM